MLFETHENGVKRPGLQPSYTAQLVTVAPVGWTLHEPFQHQESLGRYAWNLHGSKSIYVDLVCQAFFPDRLLQGFWYHPGMSQPHKAPIAIGGFYQRWCPPIAFISVVAWAVWIHYFNPSLPVGTYVTFLAFLAVVVTIWPPENRWNKTAWIAVFFFLMLFEIHNLYRDRAEHDKEQAEARENERKEFQSIADGLKVAINQSELAFAATMRRLGHLGQLSSEEINEATGGDSFCYVDMGGISGGGLIANIVQCGFRGKAVTIPRSFRSAFRNEAGHDSGMNPGADSDFKPVTLSR